MGYIILDTATGEIVNELEEGDRIVRNKSIESYASNKENIKLNDKEQFIKLYLGSVRDLIGEEITSNEWKIVLVCLEHLSYVTGGIMHKCSNNFMSIEDIAEYSGVNIKRVYSGIDNLVKKKILHKGKTGKELQIFMNPFIFMRGCYINKTLYSMFYKSKWNKKKDRAC